ncbi:hypothetical protein PIB30_057303 [Stylosanthes scabra]|uniref:Uncharacterized protein n=1 Tax=Stylosanthes scabra TaxID=79078 RepID=A0ABU6XJV9_9FABA|nr:hypothetical protein [Stylosanthes scabra]
MGVVVVTTIHPPLLAPITFVPELRSMYRLRLREAHSILFDSIPLERDTSDPTLFLASKFLLELSLTTMHDFEIHVLGDDLACNRAWYPKPMCLQLRLDIPTLVNALP